MTTKIQTKFPTNLTPEQHCYFGRGALEVLRQLVLAIGKEEQLTISRDELRDVIIDVLQNI